MEYQEIIVTKGPIARIVINRPEKRNTLSPVLHGELISALHELDADDECRVIILEGAGKGFCAGGDLGTMGGDKEVSIVDTWTGNKRMPTLFKTIADIGKIVIAKVHGFAVAGGLGLAVACDMTIVADNAKLGTPEILRALFPFMITAPISRCMPQKKMFEMCFTADYITPEQAVEYGIANYAVPVEELEDKVMYIAERIARHSPAAIRMGKRAVYTQRDMEYGKALEYLSDCITLIRQTKDVKEGTAAFFEKRDPVWQGR